MSQPLACQISDPFQAGSIWSSSPLDYGCELVESCRHRCQRQGMFDHVTTVACVMAEAEAEPWSYALQFNTFMGISIY
jgi:hypothetical protein